MQNVKLRVEAQHRQGGKLYWVWNAAEVDVLDDWRRWWWRGPDLMWQAIIEQVGEDAERQSPA